MTRRFARCFQVVVAAGALGLTLAAGAEAQPAPGRPAPEITAGKWINSTPLTIGDLRGRVVAVEFWTFG